MQAALPYIQSGLDYLANNGPQVVAVIKGLAGTFIAMKFAPALKRLFTGAGGLLFGTSPPGGNGKTSGLLGIAKGLWSGGQSTAGKAFDTFGMAKEFLGTALVDAKLQGTGTLLRGLLGETRLSSGLGGYFGSVKGAWGNLLNTGIGGGIARAVTGTGGVAKEILSGISQATGLTDLVNNGIGLAKGGAGWLTGKGAGILSFIAGSAPAKALGGAAGAVGSLGSAAISQVGSFAGAGAGLLGSVWGPMASGFGSLFLGAAPVIGAISGIIAVVSILGDHLEDIRGIVGNVFGDSGLAVFDSFIGKLQEAGGFISGLFGEGGVASALAPLRENIIGLFGPEAGAAFDGLTGILQSVMGVVGQIVSFSTGTVKPIIQDIFGYITGTVVPILLQTFTDAAPTISAIIDGLGTGIMAGMQTIGTVIQAVLPIIQGLITALLRVGSVVVPAVLQGVQVFASGIGNVMTAIQGFFNGLITFITGVFSGNWRQAWDGVKQIFGNAFDALVELCKTPVNAVVSIINSVISKINGMNITIPEWVPVFGGNSFSVNLPTLPTFAQGGFTNGPSIAGEAGTEAVISFQRGVRGQNIATWMQAGRMLGLKEIDAPLGWGGGGGGGQIVFAPQITVQGNADRSVIDEALAKAKAEFEAWYEEMVRRHRRTDY